MRAPRGSTPEDELLVQFQGMIAEYERAQILERSRRGKRHRARQGEVGVLSGAPFGYRFIRKTDHSAAHYQIDEDQARVVRRIFELYSVQGLSIGAIARLLNEQAIPTCKRRGRWERSTVWGMLRNPAFKGQACFGKTMLAPRQRITRPIRIRGGIAPRNSASHERPREDWITIAVPPIVSEETFALAQERLEANKTYAPRRTITPSVVQGLVSCANAVTLCIAHRRDRAHARSTIIDVSAPTLGGDFPAPFATTIQCVRIFWTGLFGRNSCGCSKILNLSRTNSTDGLQLREKPTRPNAVRRLSGATRSHPQEHRSLAHRLSGRPSLARRAARAHAEPAAARTSRQRRTAGDRRPVSRPRTYLRLAETLATFLTRLRSAAEALDVLERQRVLRLLVKEILVGDDKIIIRHCIPLPMAPARPASRQRGPCTAHHARLSFASEEPSRRFWPTSISRPSTSDTSAGFPIHGTRTRERAQQRLQSDYKRGRPGLLRGALRG